MQVLHTVLYAFPYCTYKENFPTIKSLFSWWSNLFIPFIPMALMFDSGVVISGEIRHFSHLRVNRFIHGDVMWPYNYRISKFSRYKVYNWLYINKNKKRVANKIFRESRQFLTCIKRSWSKLLHFYCFQYNFKLNMLGLTIA